MKKLLFLLFSITLVLISKPSFAQGIYGGYQNKSAYTPMSIETRENAKVRKSHDYNVTYSSYDGPKSYVEVEFKRENGSLAYSLSSSGYIWDGINQVSGSYFVGETAGYKIRKVYIRWEHGGETWGTLNYGERSDGRPKFHINHKVYSPIIEY